MMHLISFNAVSANCRASHKAGTGARRLDLPASESVKRKFIALDQALYVRQVPAWRLNIEEAFDDADQRSFDRYCCGRQDKR
ncbi:MAG: hypothetical protein ACXV74_10765 [Methylobacter sp.]